MSNTSYLERPVGQLVAEKPSRSRVFERLGIDYCCGGKQDLRTACAEKELNPNEVLKDLEASDSSSTGTETDWTKESMTALCDHIVKVHHGYLKEALPRISMLTERVAERHGRNFPHLIEVKEIFAKFREDTESHNFKEEGALFPAIRSMESKDGPNPLVNIINKPITQMLSDHDDAGEALGKMNKLTNGYKPTEQACNTHRAMLDALAELESDMHRHIHLENNILFPRALKTAQDLGLVK